MDAGTRACLRNWVLDDEENVMIHVFSPPESRRWYCNVGPVEFVGASPLDCFEQLVEALKES